MQIIYSPNKLINYVSRISKITGLPRIQKCMCHGGTMVVCFNREVTWGPG